MTVADFINECSALEFSKLNYDLMLECSQIALMERYLENQEFIEKNKDIIKGNRNIFTESYFQEANTGTKNNVADEKHGAVAHVFIQIWKIIVNLFKRFWKALKSVYYKISNLFTKFTYIDPDDLLSMLVAGNPNLSKIIKLLADFIGKYDKQLNELAPIDVANDGSIISDAVQKFGQLIDSLSLPGATTQDYYMGKLIFVLLYAIKYGGTLNKLKYFTVNLGEKTNKAQNMYAYSKGYFVFKNASGQSADDSYFSLKYLNRLSLVSDELALACNDNNANLLSKNFIRLLEKTNDTMAKIVKNERNKGINMNVSLVPINAGMIEDMSEDLKKIHENFEKCLNVINSNAGNTAFFTDLTAAEINDFRDNIMKVNTRVATYMKYTATSLALLNGLAKLSVELKKFK